MNYRGTVAGGSHRAAALGYPTANIPLEGNESGIHAARVAVDEKEYFAVAFADPARKILEAHLFDFEGNLYGKEIIIFLEKKLRESEAFADEGALRAAMDQDAQQARRHFGI